jgi:flagellar basal-body rod protein FlgB
VISDLTIRTLQASLHGLDAKKRAAEDNIANVETPGFTAKVVSFEDSLTDAVRRGRPLSAEITTNASTEPSRMNGNNVAIGDEMTGLTDTALRQQLTVQALNSKYTLLRTVIGS